MPRIPRQKSPESIYHVMIKSIKEVDLFVDDEDRMKYLSLLKKYKDKYQFKIYAYCLLDTHGHLMIDCNGADISRIMHSINFSYAIYYNKKYERRGHLFMDRFKSKIVDTEEYLIVLSAYIHNNAKDIYGYENKLDKYEFSSLKEYINKTNTFGILDPFFLTDIIGLGREENLSKYITLVKKTDSEDKNLDMEFINEGTEYKSYRRIIPREYEPEKVIEFVSNYLKVDKEKVRVKYKREFTPFRAISCFLLSCYCDISQKKICYYIGNIVQTRVSKLSNMGMEMVFKDKGILNKFLQEA
ncbi:transposase [Dethiothermospora halolimnae]|uniref:transposase n=1 Tax=Dethiothermospora halolimnae TaxID=3114390 RepID=UPI003CCBE46E